MIIYQSLVYTNFFLSNFDLGSESYTAGFSIELLSVMFFFSVADPLGFSLLPILDSNLTNLVFLVHSNVSPSQLCLVPIFFEFSYYNIFVLFGN